MKRCHAVVGSAAGVGARHAATLAVAAGRFRSEIAIESGARRADAKSVLGVMMLGAKGGERLTVCAAGDDQDQAAEAIAAMLAAPKGPGA